MSKFIGFQKIDFTSKVNMDIYKNSLHVDAEGGSAEVEIKWSLIMEIYSDGVQGFEIEVPNQDVMAMVSMYNQEKDEEYEKEMKIEIRDVSTECWGNSTVRNMQVYPKNLEVYKGKYTLIFK